MSSLKWGCWPHRRSVVAPSCCPSTLTTLKRSSPGRWRRVRQSANRWLTCFGVISTASLMILSGTAGTSASICATSPTTRSWRAPPERSLEMRYQLLGTSGLRVSQLFLGAMTFGEQGGVGAPLEECRLIFDAYADAGGNVIIEI